MNELDIPIVKKLDDLYRTFHEYRRVVPKQDRFTLFERSESLILEVIEFVLAGSTIASPAHKAAALDRASAKLNVLRFLVRLLKEVRAIDSKKYLILQEMIDETGRMLGGWIRSANAAARGRE